MGKISCRACHSNKLVDILDLGSTPLADRFPDNPNVIEEKYPLELAVCCNCWLVQLKHNIDPSLLFGDDYGFFTSGSPVAVEHFRQYAEDMIKDFPEHSRGNVLEIASNDGTLLKHFQDCGAKAMGIDPAKPAVDKANADNIPTAQAFFNSDVAKKFTTKANLILANNVIAHVPDLNDFVEGVKLLLADDGVFILEVQYLPNLLFGNAFDNIYHEHYSYFSLTPLAKLLKSHGLGIFDVKQVDGHGGSIRVFACHAATRIVEDSVAQMLKTEKELGLIDLAVYLDFSKRVIYIKNELQRIITELKVQGKKIYGYGASAKSNTLLNFCGIDNRYLDCVIDKTPFKFGKYTPGTFIPIEEEGIAQSPDYYLVLVWNYLGNIIRQERKFIEGGGRFIVPIPVPTIL